MEILPEEIKTKIMLYTLSCPFKEELKNYPFNKWETSVIVDDIGMYQRFYDIHNPKGWTTKYYEGVNYLYFLSLCLIES